MPSKQHKTTEDINKEIVNRIPERINDGDLSVLEEVYSADFVGYTPDGEKYTLEEPIAGFGTMLEAFPDFEIVVEEQIAENDVVSTRYTMRGTHSNRYDSEMLVLEPTNREIEFSGVIMHRLDNEKIVGETNFSDDLSFLQQLGVIPEELEN